MDKKIKKEWLAALRGSEYKQARRALRRFVRGEERFCCIGVLGDLIVDGEWDDQLLLNEKLGCYIDEYNVCEFAGIDTSIDGAVAVLMSKNDSGVSFNAIADWIDQNL